MLSKVITKKISSRKVQFSGHFLTFFTLVENHQKSLLFQFLNFCIKKSIFNIEYFVVFGVKKCIFLLSFRTVLWEIKFPSKKKKKLLVKKYEKYHMVLHSSLSICVFTFENVHLSNVLSSIYSSIDHFF